MHAFSTAPALGDEIIRIAVRHGGKRTTVSMDSSVWALLMAQLKNHEAARDWVRSTAAGLTISNTRSPSLSRRIQSAIIKASVIALQGSTPPT